LKSLDLVHLIFCINKFIVNNIIIDNVLHHNNHRTKVDKTIYMRRAEKVIENNPKSIYYKANFYNRLGEFKTRNKDSRAAKRAFLKSYALSQEVNFTPNLKNVVKALHQIYLDEKDYKNAYKYGQEISSLEMQTTKNEDKETLTKSNLIAQAEQKEIAVKQATLRQQQKTHRDLWIIALILLVLFIAAIFISSTSVSSTVIGMVSFFIILFLFQFVSIVVDMQIHHFVKKSYLIIFLIKIVVISLIYPIHKIIELYITKLLLNKKLVKKPNTGKLNKLIQQIYPFFDSDNSNKNS